MFRITMVLYLLFVHFNLFSQTEKEYLPVLEPTIPQPPTFHVRNIVRNRHISIPDISYARRRYNLAEFLYKNATDWPVRFDTCDFIENGGFFEFSPEKPFTVSEIDFSNSTVQARIAHFTSNLSFRRSRITNVLFDSCKNLQVTLSDSTVVDTLHFVGIKNLQLLFKDHTQSSKSQILVGRSTVKLVDLAFESRNFRPHKYIFEMDTIYDVRVINESRPYKSSRVNDQRIRVLFNDCYLNGSFKLDYVVPDMEIVFTKCTFGPAFTISELYCKKIFFRDCVLRDSKIDIRFSDMVEYPFVEILNTDVTNFYIDWSTNLKIGYDPGYDYTADDIDNEFKNLLNKYEKENRKESYKSVDLQYKKYSQNGWVGFWDDAWWGHGYDRNRVYLWALGLILVFSIINYILWDRIQVIYPLFPLFSGYHPAWERRLHKIFSVILYSAFIFFSLSISLDKLKQKPAWLVLVFLFQYFAGLFTLVFILKAVFNPGW